MKYDEFMLLLGTNLDMDEAEKEEVLRYYSEYLNDVGEENMEAAIKEIGNPVKLAKKLSAEYRENWGGEESRTGTTREKVKDSIEDSIDQIGKFFSGALVDVLNLAGKAMDAAADAARKAAETVGEKKESGAETPTVEPENRTTPEEEAEAPEVDEIHDKAEAETEKAESDELFGWLPTTDELINFTEEAAGAVTRETRKAFTSLRDILTDSERHTFEYTNMNMDSFSSIYVKVKNCPISVYRSVSGKYGVEVKLNLRNDQDARISVDNDTLYIENLEAKGSWIAMGLGREYVNIYLPEAIYHSMELITTNDRIEFSRISNVSNVKLETTNARIHVRSSLLGTLTAETSNGGILLEKMEAEKISLNSSNAGVTIEEVRATTLESVTSNGTIRVRESEIGKDLNLRTSNAAISVLLPGEEKEYAIHANTSNANIMIGGESRGREYVTAGGEKEVLLRTSNGRIELAFKG